MGPKLMNCCKSEQVGTKEYGKMLERIHVLEAGSIPARKARNWMIEGQEKKDQKERNTEDRGLSSKRQNFGTERSFERRQRENVARQR